MTANFGTKILLEIIYILIKMLYHYDPKSKKDTFTFKMCMCGLHFSSKLLESKQFIEIVYSVCHNILKSEDNIIALTILRFKKL